MRNNTFLFPATVQGQTNIVDKNIQRLAWPKWKQHGHLEYQYKFAHLLCNFLGKCVSHYSLDWKYDKKLSCGFVCCRK